MINLDEKKLMEILIRSRYRVVLLIAFAASFAKLQPYVTQTNTIVSILKNLPLERFGEAPPILNIVFKVFLTNWTTAYLSILGLAIILALYSIYKNRVIYLMIGVTLVYSFYISILWVTYTSQLLATDMVSTLLDNAALDLALTTLLLSLLEFFRPIFTYRRISKRITWRPIFASLDLFLYIFTILISAIAVIMIADYLVDILVNLSNYSAPEIRELINIYVTSSIGRILIYIMSLGIITYFLYNLVEPMVIYMTKSKNQAKELMTQEYRKMMSKEIGGALSVNKYIFIGIIIILTILIPIVAVLWRQPDTIIEIIVASINNLLTFRWTAPVTRLDEYLSNLNPGYLISTLKERIEAFIRFIMYLIF